MVPSVWINIMPKKREISKSRSGNHVQNDNEATICGDGQSVKHFKLGDIAWIKTGDCWWPGQVYRIVKYS